MLIPSEGSKHCKIAFIGEAPGAQEEIEGKPFCGMAGNILNTKLHQVGLARSECYITNLVKVKPQGNDFSIYWKGQLPTEELKEWKQKLLVELDSLETNVCVPLGNNALWALTGHTSITKWRGSILECILPSGRVMKVIGTYHPAAVLRQWSFGAVMTLDFRRAIREAEFPEVKKPIRNLIIAPTTEEMRYFINSNMTFNDCSNLKQLSVDVAYDIETAHGSITCVSLAFSPSNAISIPTTLKFWGTVGKLRDAIRQIEWVLTQNKGVKIAQNATFDIQYLLRMFNILPTKPWGDTMVAQHSCYSEMPKSLAFLTSIYTDEPYYKDDLKVWQSEMTNDELLWTYNAKDAAITYEIFLKLIEEMKALGVTHIYNFMMELLEPLLFMMLRGVKVDETKRQEYRDKFIPQLEEKIKLIQATYGNVNPNSPKQVATLIEKLGLKPVINHKTGKSTTNKKALTKLSAKSPELKEIINAREEKTLISNFLEITTDVDGRLRCSFNSTGTETGRLSSSESVFWCGRNLQNFPKKVRDIIIPDEGKMFTECDLMGAEARIVAYLCNDQMLIKLMEEGKNVHTYTANLIWGINEEEVEKDKKEKEAMGKDTDTFYYKAKRIRHSGNYKGTWVTLSEQLGISAMEAKALLAKYYIQSPSLTRWHKQVEEKIKSSHTLTTVLGRKRIFFDRMGDSLIREAIAYEPQEVVAHILNLGLIRFYNEVCKIYPEIEVLLNVHDSILVQHLPSQKELVEKELHRCMRTDLTINEKTFFIPIDVKSGMNWRELK